MITIDLIMKKISQRLILSLACFLPSLSLADALVPAQVEPLIVLRGNIDYPPDEMYRKGKLTGFNIELIENVAASISLPVVFKSYPWKRSVTHFKDGKGDAITYFSKTDERENYTLFLEGNILTQTDYHFIVNKKRVNELQFSGDLNSLANLTIGAKRGYHYGEEFKRQENIKKVEFNTTEQIESSLLTNRIDFGILTKIEFAEKQALNLFQRLDILSPALSSTVNYLAFSKARNSSNNAERFAAAMQAYKQSAEFETLKKKYNK